MSVENTVGFLGDAVDVAGYAYLVPLSVGCGVFVLAYRCLLRWFICGGPRCNLKPDWFEYGMLTVGAALGTALLVLAVTVIVSIVAPLAVQHKLASVILGATVGAIVAVSRSETL